MTKATPMTPHQRTTVRAAIKAAYAAIGAPAPDREGYRLLSGEQFEFMLMRINRALHACGAEDTGLCVRPATESAHVHVRFPIAADVFPAITTAVVDAAEEDQHDL